MIQKVLLGMLVNRLCTNLLNLQSVGKSYIDQVHISIKGDTGEAIPFITGKTLIKLHFKLKE